MNNASFDTWTSLFLVVAIQGIFLSILFFKSSEEKQTGKNILGAFILAFSVMLIYYVAFWTGYRVYLANFDWVFLSLVFAFGPLLYAYIYKLETKKLPPKINLHFIPLGLYFLAHLIFMFSRVELPDTNLNSDFSFIFKVLTIGQVFHLIIYALVILDIIRKRTILKRNSWQSNIALSFTAFSLFHASYYVMVFFGTYSLTLDYLISFSMSFFIYMLGYSALQIRPFTITKNSAPLLTEQASSFYLERLKALMDEKKPFLEGDLKLHDLAALLEIQTHALSQLINDKFNKNFSEYINYHRIKEAEKILMKDEEQKSKIINIAYEVGFNTKASFYSAFKKKNNISPKEFRALVTHKASQV
jgi:AraC-like DNA-binding protein